MTYLLGTGIATSVLRQEMPLLKLDSSTVFSKEDHNLTQQLNVLQRGLVNRDRKKVSKSKWLHSKNQTPDTFPHLVDNSWSLGEFLEEI